MEFQIFCYLVEVSITNSYQIYKVFCQNSQVDSLSSEEFRIRLIESFAIEYKEYLHQFSNSREPREQSNYEIGRLRRKIDRHFLIKMVSEGMKDARKDCHICSNRGLNQRKRTIYVCEQCVMPLCPDECFKTYHTV